MTPFLSWFSTHARKAVLDIDREYGITLSARSRRLILNEYLPLYHYLEHRYASLVVLTFEQIESLLGFALPEAAFTDVAWWTSESVTDPHTETWHVAGRLATPNLLAATVAFERLSEVSSGARD